MKEFKITYLGFALVLMGTLMFGTYIGTTKERKRLSELNSTT